MPYVDHANVVSQLYEQEPADKTVQGALAFTLRVIAALSWEKYGLVLKPSGENIYPYNGIMVSVSRVMEPGTGQLYKVLSDVPATNEPEWIDDGTVDPGRYVPVQEEPVPPPVPPMQPPPVPDPGPDVSGTLQKISEAVALLDARLNGIQVLLADVATKQAAGLVGKIPPTPPFLTHEVTVTLRPPSGP